jgi:hypothetical protein
LSKGGLLGRAECLTYGGRSLFLFSTQASQRLGEVIIRDRKPVKQVCGEFFIDPATPLAAEAHKRAAELAVKGLISKQSYISPPEALRDYWAFDYLLAPSLHPDTYRSLMGDLINCRLPERVPELQKVLVEVIHKR